MASLSHLSAGWWVVGDTYRKLCNGDERELFIVKMIRLMLQQMVHICIIKIMSQFSMFHFKFENFTPCSAKNLWSFHHDLRDLFDELTCLPTFSPFANICLHSLGADFLEVFSTGNNAKSFKCRSLLLLAMVLVELQNTCKKKLNRKVLERPNICYF